MSTTLAIRSDGSLRAALARGAGAEGRAVSGVERQILENAPVERLVDVRTDHLRGRLQLAEFPAETRRQRFRERSWRSRGVES